MRLFITGASGHLGSRIISRLRDSCEIELFGLRRRASSMARLADTGDRVRWYNGDDLSVQEIVRQIRPDAVLHAATRYGRAGESLAELLEANVAMPVRILEAAIGCDTKAFINIDTLLGREVSAYALSKGQFREWLRMHAGAIRAVDVASELFFGTGGNEGNFVTGLVRKLVRGGGGVPLTAGEHVRDFVIIDDLVAAIECVLRHVTGRDRDPGYERFEVGGGSPRTVRDFATLVRDAVGGGAVPLDFGLIPYRPNEAMRVVPDLAAIKKLGWAPAASFRDTIASMAREERACLQNIS